MDELELKARADRRRRILEVLRVTPLEDALAQPGFLEDLTLEAESSDPRDPDTIITPDVLENYLAFADAWRSRKTTALLANRGARVIVVPGFMGSTLRDTTGPYKLIWVDPSLAVNGEEINGLKLAPLSATEPERDGNAGVTVQATGVVPLAYDLLGWFLWMNGYSVNYAPYDWRKHLDESARKLEQMIRDHYAQTSAPVRIIAHSQGSLVARRALQLLGAENAKQMVQMLVLLGPATFGTFSAVQALVGTIHELEMFRRFAINVPLNVERVFQSMSGLYQLIPWNKELMPSVISLRDASFWKTGIDKDRLNLCGWAKNIDARFFNDRTRIILGDAETVESVSFENNRLIPKYTTAGDGTVPDLFAKIQGVTTYKAPKATHGLMAANYVVCKSVISLLGGSSPNIRNLPLELNGAGDGVLQLQDERPWAERRPKPAAGDVATRPSEATTHFPILPPEPAVRRLRVFALDPMLSTSLETAQYSELTVELNWDDVGSQPAAVGEYVEVVDVDPQSGRYYPPVDLNHPHLLAQDGLRPSELDPQFHQQMTFAVSMATIRVFEKALGRLALWSPRLQRDKNNRVINKNYDSQFVQRLRIYPHAMRQANAFYDPDRKALLFGYFPAQARLGARVKQGGTVFTCTSFDIIAHETTHALLDGLHRYLIYPSNPDVLAFHEGFSDIVALLQRFSHREFLRAQLASSGGDLIRQNLLGQLAGQFAEASQGHGNGLRQYLGKLVNGVWVREVPCPKKIQELTEPHERGAILVAAVFQALVNIYERRSADLLRIASPTGREINLKSSPDLLERLADEAATSAQHLLRMCVRALDYLPPVDLTLGEYLRAIITADYDLVRNDDRNYRIAVVDAFRQWGITPADSNTLLTSDLLWQAPEDDPLPNLIKWIEAERKAERFAEWMIGMDRQRAFRSRSELGASLRSWLLNNKPRNGGASLGICLDERRAPLSIQRDKEGLPVFEVHAVHPCSRLGPDGQHLQDLVIEIVQRRKVMLEPEDQQQLESGELPYSDAEEYFYFRGGCTLIVDGRSGAIRYAVRKAVNNEQRLADERSFRRNPTNMRLAMTYFEGDDRSPFRLLHQH
ncbi:hypothetical protein NA78x_003032 [Anatilimnocola sp. NA78]|uniref:lipase/acyltransferase domain-containing protein n=1 Tax=Anatilimnocola sp. NA78 TaxID=3415683 RepID=UPI003CE589D5